MGELPWYSDFFFLTCNHNLDVDVYLICDQQKQHELPAKVKIVYRSLSEIRDAAEEKLVFKVNLNYPYKLCDFKPAYGLIFKDLIIEYDFWGYSDIDVIYGKIRDFIDEDLLGRFDIISVRPEYLTGFFALFRNDSSINSLFLNSPDWQYVFQQYAYCGFDECAELCFELIDGKELSRLPTKICSMTHVIHQQAHELVIKTHFDLFVVEFTPGNLLYHQGKLIYDSKYEVLLYHLNWFKTHEKLEIPNWEIIPNSFHINEYNFTRLESQQQN